MKLQEALKIMKDDKRKIFAIETRNSMSMEDEIFFVTHDSMYNEETYLRGTEDEDTNEEIKTDILYNKVTLSHNYREITEDEFNYLWELDYDERFPELKESFEYYDQVVYKQTEGE